MVMSLSRGLLLCLPVCHRNYSQELTKFLELTTLETRNSRLDFGSDLHPVVG